MDVTYLTASLITTVLGSSKNLLALEPEDLAGVVLEVIQQGLASKMSHVGTGDQFNKHSLILLCHKVLARSNVDLPGIATLKHGGGLWVWKVVHRAAHHGLPPMSRRSRRHSVMSIPVELSSKAPIENSSLHFDSITSIAAWWFKAGEVVEIEIDDGLQSFAGRGVAQPVRQGLGPCGIVGL